MTVLLTGAAGFIGYHVAEALLAADTPVIGVDNLNHYYDVRLKQARLDRLTPRPGFTFHAIDVADRAAMEALAAAHPGIEVIVHLAAQAGVRHSLVDPHAYVQTNVVGHLVVLEIARRLPRLRHLVYASTSSVYGASQALPFRETDRTDTPLSLYAATKLADELMGHAYAHLFGIPQTGLRFFTVYGPWGRPDMAYYSFARAIVAGEPITLFDDGWLKRDFTYIDDIVAGVVGVLDRAPPSLMGGGKGPPAGGGVTPPPNLGPLRGPSPQGEGVPFARSAPASPPARVLNIGNHRAEEVRTLVALLEQGLGRNAVVRSAARPAADVMETFASVEAIGRLAGFVPRVSLAEGIGRFVAWFRAFHGV
ncbi:MAG TPA: NAD-dependent epimerase/dehydratase family protein [Acetobacteraceae bacterium]|nr:NAD-dependent epimerase/dehydratase family protein [Acetobacteraceae bacterium]